MNNSLSIKFRPHEQLLLHLESPPWSALYRIGLGLSFVYTYNWLVGSNSVWIYVACLLAFLFSLRLFPAIMRKVLPFSRDLNHVWSERRAMAKRFDSYQWRKLFWLGIGIACFEAAADDAHAIVTISAGLFIVCGGLGLLMWRYHCRTFHDEHPTPSRTTVTT